MLQKIISNVRNGVGSLLSGPTLYTTCGIIIAVVYRDYIVLARVIVTQTEINQLEQSLACSNEYWPLTDSLQKPVTVAQK